MADALEVRGLRVQRAEHTILHDITFGAHYGSVTAILGPNGAGKTTLLKAIIGLLPHRGEVMLAGQNISHLAARERAKMLAFVPQHSLLSSALPVRQVVLQGRYPHLGGIQRPRATDQRIVEDAMARVDVQHFAERSYTSLSFGEQRRVLLARGLATGARVLCLDEPTASLDVAHALSLYALLRNLAREGHCIVMVMHQLDEALTQTDNALLISAGHNRGHGPTHEVIQPAAIAEVYGVDMRPNAGLRFDLITEGEGG